MSQRFLLDGSFAGLLCSIHQAWRLSALPQELLATNREAISADLFSADIYIATDNSRAAYIAQRLQRLWGRHGYGQIYYAFLSEDEQIPGHILSTAYKALTTPPMRPGPYKDH